MAVDDLERAVAALALSHQALTAADAIRVISASRTSDRPLVAALLDTVGESQLLEAIAFELDLPWVDLYATGNAYRVDEQLVRMCDIDMLKAHNALPLRGVGDQVAVAMANPRADQDMVDYLRAQLPENPLFVLAPTSQIQAKLVYFETSDYTAAEEDPEPAAAAAPPATVADNPIVEWVDNLLARAVAEGASDVHFKFEADGSLLVRFRVDGIMRRQAVPLRRREREIIGTLLSKCPTIDASDRTRPQDGTFSFAAVNGRQIDARLGMLPQAYGPTIVCRLLDPANINRKLDDMGFAKPILAQMRRVVRAPQGAVFVIGPTGSGKAVHLSTIIPTPSGQAVMGDLKRGDWVLGGDGKPCRVTGLSAINKTPDLYRVRFSDGQEILADADHQWLVATHHGRSVPRTKKRKATIARHAAAHAAAAAIDTLAAAWDGAPALTADELLEALREHGLAGEFANSKVVAAALEVTECPRSERPRTLTVTNATTRKQWTFVYPTRRVLEEVARMPSDKAARAASLLETALPSRATMRELDVMLGAGKARTARTAAVRLGLAGEAAEYDLSFENVYEQHHSSWEFPAEVAFKSLAMRLLERFHTAPSDTATLSRMTTGEMLGAGVHLKSGHANFAVPVTRPLELSAADLPIDPYLLGYWLGDGFSAQGAVVVGDQDLDFARNELASILPVRREDRVDGATLLRFPAILSASLRDVGVLGNKHVPGRYLRGSREQRLALLQGLMDTDGTVDAHGSCELSLSDRTLVTGALELIRSLGIKASITWDRPASYRDETGQLVECKDRHRIHFTTTEPVFRLPRKASRLPQEVRETQKWLYITDITPVTPDDPAYGPARCISVDSPDHTYLCGDGYVVTSNTTTLYGLLKELPALDLNVLTAEDPIEYRLPYIGQTQIRGDLGEKSLTFAKVLRSMLRLDPDVILVGEVRDNETAKTALDAAISGHLVLSTLHAKSAIGAYSRLEELGVNPYLASEAVSLTVNQRLIRRVHDCATTSAPNAGEVAFLTRHGLEVPDRVARPNRNGCPGCNQTGYRGRIAVVEVLEASPEVREMVAARRPAGDILAAAQGEGYTSILADSHRHVLNGHTTVGELLRCIDTGGI